MLDEDIAEFQVLLLEWYNDNKREFPWRYTFNAYKVFISEILLQQTNVEKIIEPYNKIIDKYKNINELADSNIDFLRNIFINIGLFYRADRLINISKEFMIKYNGEIPSEWNELIKIKGIGRYLCSAILCFGYNKPYAVLDTNVIRVLSRILDIKSERSRPRDDKKLWEVAQILLPENYVDYNYALLDFASKVCTATKPNCYNCVYKYVCMNVQ